ncbi:MAG: serpin family protein [Bacteroidales bacterium]
MKTVEFLTILVLAVVLSTTYACKKDNNNKPEPVHLDLSLQGKMLVSASNDFAFRIFRETELSTAVEENVMISPLSISFALGMTLNGANSSTFDSIRQVLGFDQLTMHDINYNYKQLVPFLVNADPTTTLKIANSIWYKTGFTPEQPFLDTCSHYFNATVSQLDFSNPASLNTINNWVAGNTNNKITQLLSSLKPEDVMYLINAVYFKGNWTVKFDPSETKQAAFFKTSGQTNVATMNGKNTYKFYSNNDFTMLELDYGQTNFAMDLLLPNSGKDLTDILQQLDAANFDNWTQNLNTIEDMKIAIPKFKFEYEKSLNEILSAMGMGVAFTEFADFSGISTTLPLLITEVKHKTFVDVNEEGTEAAAATSVGIGYTSMPPSFIADHPFLFIIRERDTNTVLFIGKVCDPQY